MDWEKVERRLERSFSARWRRFGSTAVSERRRPFPLAPAISDTLTAEEVEEYGDLVAWPGSFSELLAHNKIEQRELLRFYWEGLGPISWGAGLVLIGNGRRRYLACWDEIESYRALAALDPWDDPLAVSAVVKRLLVRNGATFGIAMFGSLPTETSNHAPDLVPVTVVRQAYFDLMQWWECERGSPWIDLADEHFGRIVEPNHLQRGLDILETLPMLTQSGALGQWLEDRDTESAAMPDEIRQRLFDEWFGSAYDEPR
jgi:hypothetical protein